MAAATEAATAAAGKEEAADEKTVMVVAIDESEHSYYALEWTLEHFSPKLRGPSPPFKLVIVHAKPIPSSVLTLGAPGAVDVLPFVEADLRKSAASVVEKAREVCEAKSVSPLVEVVEGDARYVLCEAVEKHHADMLVVGSHGYGAVKRAVLGSVSDYCAHHAQCTVMIVKKPRSKG
ncbi:universal stress protein PHOS34 [Elaeis guineensis]|uniref:Universal stress protein PHOS34 n=1 Tax=Elaeis guineensis var. tenera TaxID=51953 RepID=A0A8N4F3T5_ELAGV|nr:universal stress protein PHOS34 [Elaeis guineensis]